MDSSNGWGGASNRWRIGYFGSMNKSKSKQTIFFVGPLPPPVNGFSEITRMMLDKLDDDSKVVVFDMSARVGLHRFVFQIVRFIVLALRLKPASLYLAFSGGRRQWFDGVFLLIANVLRIKSLVHHHSFAYLTEKQWSTALISDFNIKASHIALCEGMSGMLGEQYGIGQSQRRVISNVIFLDAGKQDFSPSPPSKHLRIGFLSNITREKGIFEFFSIVKAAVEMNIAIEARVAGPVAQDILAEFNELIKSEYVRYVGPVYGADKDIFFGSIDVLVFPTLYVNEAEPVTIWEAYAKGIPVISFDRGCISEIISGDAGLVVDIENRVDAQIKIFALLKRYSEDPEFLSSAKFAAHKSFLHSRERNKQALLDAIGFLKSPGGLDG